jgi:hypothetical protein
MLPSKDAATYQYMLYAGQKYAIGALHVFSEPGYSGSLFVTFKASESRESYFDTATDTIKFAISNKASELVDCNGNAASKWTFATKPSAQRISCLTFRLPIKSLPITFGDNTQPLYIHAHVKGGQMGSDCSSTVVSAQTTCFNAACQSDSRKGVACKSGGLVNSFSVGKTRAPAWCHVYGLTFPSLDKCIRPNVCSNTFCPKQVDGYWEKDDDDDKDDNKDKKGGHHWGNDKDDGKDSDKDKKGGYHWGNDKDDDKDSEKDKDGYRWGNDKKDDKDSDKDRKDGYYWGH